MPASPGQARLHTDGSRQPADIGIAARIVSQQDQHESCQEAQQKIGEIQSKKEGNQRFILSPEAKAELAKLQKEQTDANKHLRVVRKELRQDEESLENRLKWVNIAAMPAAVTVAGLVLAALRKKRTVAR